MPLRAAIRGPFAALGEGREGVVGGRRRSLVGDEASVRKFQVVLIRGTLERAAKEWTEMGMDHEWSHADGVTEPLDNRVHVEWPIIVGKAGQFLLALGELCRRELKEIARTKAILEPFLEPDPGGGSSVGP